MFKTTIEIDKRVITQSLSPDEYNLYISHIQEMIGQERGWLTLRETNHGIVILSSDHLRRAFIKIEEV